MALEGKRETFLQTPGHYFEDSQAAGCTSARESAEEGTRLSRSHATDFLSLSNACSWFAVSFSCGTTFFAQKSGRQDEAVR